METSEEETINKLEKLFKDAETSENYEVMLNLKLEIEDAVDKYNLREYIHKYNKLSNEKDSKKN